jgi:type II secretory pathway pseudopilin PulG
MSKQRGFSLVEGLLIVVVISIVGFGGWYVATKDSDEATKNKNDSNTTVQSDDLKQSKSNEEKPVEKSSFNLEKSLESDDFGFSFNYTEEKDCTGGINSVNKAGSLYEPGSRATGIVVCPIKEGSHVSPFYLVVSVKNSEADTEIREDTFEMLEETTDYTLLSESKFTHEGVEGTKLRYESPSVEPDIDYYYFQKDELSYFIQINGLGLEHNSYSLVDLGNSIFDSFKF